MSGRGILDADMRTLASLAGRAWHWWTTELTELLPVQLRNLGKGRWPELLYRSGRLEPEGDRALPAAGGRVTLLLADGLFLARRVERPAVSDRDLQKMLAIEGDRLLPFPGDGAIVAGHIAGPAATAGRVTVAVGGIPMVTAREIADTIAASGFSAGQVLAQGADGTRIDFAPALRAAGILPAHRSLTPYLWGVVAFLVVLNVAAVIWHDVASVERSERLVQDQQPAVAIAQKISHRVEAARAVASRTAALRQQHDALGTLTAVSEALPQGAWLTKYVSDGVSVRLNGYRPPKTDVATALRNTKRFAEVQSSADDLQAALPTGEPFEVTAKIGRQ